MQQHQQDGCSFDLAGLTVGDEVDALAVGEHVLYNRQSVPGGRRVGSVWLPAVIIKTEVAAAEAYGASGTVGSNSSSNSGTSCRRSARARAREPRVLVRWKEWRDCDEWLKLRASDGVGTARLARLGTHTAKSEQWKRAARLPSLSRRAPAVAEEEDEEDEDSEQDGGEESGGTSRYAEEDEDEEEDDEDEGDAEGEDKEEGEALPRLTSTWSYLAKAGDTAITIAKRLDCSVVDVVRLNPNLVLMWYDSAERHCQRKLAPQTAVRVPVDPSVPAAERCLAGAPQPGARIEYRSNGVFAPGVILACHARDTYDVQLDRMMTPRRVDMPKRAMGTSWRYEAPCLGTAVVCRYDGLFYRGTIVSAYRKNKKGTGWSRDGQKDWWSVRFDTLRGPGGAAILVMHMPVCDVGKTWHHASCKPADGDRSAWVQCQRCAKWRRLEDGVPEWPNSVFKCHMVTWDDRHDSCEKAEEGGSPGECDNDDESAAHKRDASASATDHTCRGKKRSIAVLSTQEKDAESDSEGGVARAEYHCAKVGRQPAVSECPICFEQRPLPKLPCGHAVCASCVTQIASGDSGRLFRGGRAALVCPLCRQRVNARRPLAAKGPCVGTLVAARFIVGGKVLPFTGSVVSVRTSGAGSSSDAVVATATAYYTVRFQDDASEYELRRDQFDIVGNARRTEVEEPGDVPARTRPTPVGPRPPSTPQAARQGQSRQPQAPAGARPRKRTKTAGPGLRRDARRQSAARTRATAPAAKGRGKGKGKGKAGPQQRGPRQAVRTTQPIWSDNDMMWVGWGRDEVAELKLAWKRHADTSRSLADINRAIVSDGAFPLFSSRTESARWSRLHRLRLRDTGKLQEYVLRKRRGENCRGILGTAQ